MSVLVTDGNERAALAVTRALGERGVAVIVGAENARSLAGSSRYCRQSFVYPSPLKDPGGFVRVVIDVAKTHNVTAVFPISDFALQFLGERRSELEPEITIPIPSMPAYEWVSDKCRLMRLAMELRLPIPETVFVQNGNIQDVLDQIKVFPVVVKPGRSVTQSVDAWFKTKVHFANDREELKLLYGTHEYLQQPSLIQQRVEGSGQGVFALFDQGRPITLFAHRRLREKPPAGGVSVLRESIDLPGPMAEYAERLLQHVKWHGVAMVEFKIDKVTGTPYLIEINGRFWGSLQLAIDAGINFPYLLFEITQGMPVVVPPRAYRVGTKSRWLLGDLDHLLLRLRKSRDELNLPGDCPSRLQCLRAFMRFFAKDQYYEIERWNDPAPAFFEYWTYMKTLVSKQA